jgi:hypothetical protein
MVSSFQPGRKKLACEYMVFLDNDRSDFEPGNGRSSAGASIVHCKFLLVKVGNTAAAAKWISAYAGMTVVEAQTRTQQRLA